MVGKDKRAWCIQRDYTQMQIFQSTSLCYLFFMRELIKDGGEEETELAVTDA